LQTENVDIEPFIEAEIVAQILGMSRQWVYQAAIDGKIPGYRIGQAIRFRESEIRQWIEERRLTGRRA
jgi:excisionase family DNA binding protein